MALRNIIPYFIVTSTVTVFFKKSLFIVKGKTTRKAIENREMSPLKRGQGIIWRTGSQSNWVVWECTELWRSGGLKIRARVFMKINMKMEKAGERARLGVSTCSALIWFFTTSLPPLCPAPTPPPIPKLVLKSALLSIFSCWLWKEHAHRWRRKSPLFPGLLVPTWLTCRGLESS